MRRRKWRRLILSLDVDDYLPDEALKMDEAD